LSPPPIKLVLPLGRSGLVLIKWYQIFRFPVRYYPSFSPLDSFCVMYLESKKPYKKISATLEPFWPLQFCFRFALLSLCPWSSLVAGLVCSSS
jgi:hypothetical protein